MISRSKRLLLDDMWHKSLTVESNIFPILTSFTAYSRKEWYETGPEMIRHSMQRSRLFSFDMHIELKTTSVCIAQLQCYDERNAIYRWLKYNALVLLKSANYLRVEKINYFSAVFSSPVKINHRQLLGERILQTLPTESEHKPTQ